MWRKENFNSLPKSILFQISQLTCPAMVPEMFLPTEYRRKRSQQQKQMCLSKLCAENWSTSSCAGEQECKGFPELSHQLLILPGSHELPFLKHQSTKRCSTATSTSSSSYRDIPQKLERHLLCFLAPN